MKSLPTQAILGAVAAALMVVVGAMAGATSPVVVLVTVAAVAHVAFVAQSRPLRDEERLVYRPVYVRRQDVQRRVRTDD